MGETNPLTITLASHRILVPKEPDGFLAFWSAYPRRVGRGAARTAYIKAMRKTTLEDILQALARKRWPVDPQFIPHPSTYLNQERWLDEEIQGDPVLRAVGL